MSAETAVDGYLGLVLVEGQTDAQIYDTYSRDLVRFATGLVGPSDAQDVVSEAVLRVMSSRVWPRATNHRALLYRAVRFEAQNWKRAARRRRRRDSFSVGVSEFEIPELMPEVARAVALLSTQQRAVVFLTYWDDLDPTAVAELLGVSVGTVRKQLGRARAHLREVLG